MITPIGVILAMAIAVIMLFGYAIAEDRARHYVTGKHATKRAIVLWSLWVLLLIVLLVLALMALSALGKLVGI